MTRFRNVSCGIDLSSADVVVASDALSDASAAALATATRTAKDDGARLHLVPGIALAATEDAGGGRGRRGPRGGHRRARLARPQVGVRREAGQAVRSPRHALIPARAAC